MTLPAIMRLLFVNVAIFFAAALVAGSQAPGWLLFIPPLVPATLLITKHRYAITILINLACILVNLLTEQPWSLVIPMAMAFAAFSLIMIRITSFLQLQAEEIDRARARSDELLDVVLPPSISSRIKAGESRIAERFEEASICFADIVGFTQLSEQLQPEELVMVLDEVFTAFDELVEQHGLEKIKTIGDAYMVASGLSGSPNNLEALAEFSLQLLRAIESFNQSDRPHLAMRVGIHCGPVVAGIVGTKRFVYDVWGDTVNVAARMESHGVSKKVHVTDAVREALQDQFSFEERGTLDVKGKGEMVTWFLGERILESQ
jgi:class 3 adenylate cyclase